MSEKKPREYNFKPGASGNPAGRPGVPLELRNAMKQNRVLFMRELHSLLKTPFNDLSRLADASISGALPTQTIWLARFLMKASASSDPARANFIVEQAFSPLPKALEVSGPDGAPIAVDPLPDVDSDSLRAAFDELMKRRKKNKKK